MTEATAAATQAGYEPAKISHAKDITMYQLEKLADASMIEIGDETGEIDAIDWADAIIESLLAAGATFPDDWASRPAPWDPAEDVPETTEGLASHR